MILFNLVYYALFGFILFLFLSYVEMKKELNDFNKIVIPLIYIIFVSVFMDAIGANASNGSLFLIIVFELLFRLFNGFILNDYSEKIDVGLLFKEYVIKTVLGIMVNVIFINNVDSVILDGESLKTIVWLLVILYMYNNLKDVNFKMDKIKKQDAIKVNDSNVIARYAKLKSVYNKDVNINNKELKNILYAIMVYEDMNRSTLLRGLDNFFYGKFKGVKKLGIMQVESKTFVTDAESIAIASKKVNELYNKLKDKKNIDIYLTIIEKYYSNYSRSEKTYKVYRIIREFNELD